MQARARRCLEAAAVLTLFVLIAPGSSDSFHFGGREITVAGPGSAPLGVDPPSRPWFDTDDRAGVIAAYEEEFDSPPPVLAWSGDHDGCASGASTADHRQATLERVNFYRAMAGVPATVSEEPSFTAKAQDAALMMSAEGTLTHHPSEDFRCFSITGRQAAANSNLHLGRTGPEAIDGYMEDPGPKNTDVGHRTTVLHPPTMNMGIGDVAASPEGHAANALWVFDDHVFDEASEQDRPAVREPHRFVAWPPRGHVPAELVFPRWSFTLAGADFSRAQVHLYRLAPDGGQEVPVTVVDRIGAEGHVPLPTIVWEPESSAPTDRDTAYLVVIAGVSYFERPSITVTDDPGLTPSVASSAPSRPSSFAYTVRVLGSRPDDRLSPEAFLASIVPSPRT